MSKGVAISLDKQKQSGQQKEDSAARRLLTTAIDYASRRQKLARLLTSM